jgi:glycerophosphoryl diester phosphodiesterase
MAKEVCAMRNNLKSNRLIAGLIVLGLALSAAADEQRSGFQVLRIAHAGGGLAKVSYTNSYQALDANLEKGFRYFELDFSFTRDNELVCLHDWKFHFKRTFGFDTDQPLSLEAFEKLARDNPKYTNCTLEGLAGWMRENPSAYIVPDVKGDNLAALKQMQQMLPDANRRVISQVYDPQNFNVVKAMGFQQIIWTLYRFVGTFDEIINWAEKMQSAVAIAMPKETAEIGLARALRSRGVPTYVHTVNRPEKMRIFMDVLGVTEIFTDFMGPNEH